MTRRSTRHRPPCHRFGDSGNSTLALRAARLRTAWAALLVASVAAGAAYAQDPEGPVYLEADRVEIDERQGISTYEGNVLLTRGSLSINAQQMKIYQGEERIERVVATGEPVRFEREETPEDKPVRGQARRLEYEAAKDKVTLTEEAKLWQGQDQFSGNVITYLIGQEQVKATKGSNGERVKVIIYPDKPNEQR